MLVLKLWIASIAFSSSSFYVCNDYPWLIRHSQVLRMPFSSHILAIRIHVANLFFGLADEIVIIERNLMKADNMFAISAN